MKRAEQRNNNYCLHEQLAEQEQLETINMTKQEKSA